MNNPAANGPGPFHVSLAIFAWNEEAAIPGLVNSLFRQTFFAELGARGLICEVICLGNGCTDRTAAVAAQLFAQQASHHAHRASFRCRSVNLPQRGKLNAWNQFVHALSAREAEFLFMLDADILLHEPNALWSMLSVLEQRPEVSISVSRPRKDIWFKDRRSVRERLSLSAADLTASAPAQLCAQLYGIKATVARNIYLPKDLSACEDGFIKAVVCTDFLTRDVQPERIRLADHAEHTFEPYTSLVAVLKNQKRQIIGQTMVHILVDRYLKRLPSSERAQLGRTLREKEAADPGWLKRLISEHLQQAGAFWNLYPDVLSYRFKRLRALRGFKRLACAPAAVGGFLLSFVASIMAYRFLKRGSTDYWPRAQRAGFDNAAVPLPAVGSTCQNDNSA